MPRFKPQHGIRNCRRRDTRKGNTIQAVGAPVLGYAIVESEPIVYRAFLNERLAGLEVCN